MKFAQCFAGAAIRVAILVACIIASGTFAILGLCLWLVAANRTLPSRSAPASGYEEAVSRFNKIQSHEQQQVSPVARSILLTHGYRTAKVILFFHGYSSSPQQFRLLGEEFFRMGYNVIIPRLPGHGIADRKLTNLSNIQAEELRNCADENVDIAIGLGEKVYVGGLSAGGVLTAWIAENRKEVSRVLLIAPSFALGRKSGTFVQRLGVAVLAAFPGIAPDSYAETPAADYAYPGFSAKALAQLLRLSIGIFAAAMERPVAVQDVCLVTSKNDHAVSDFATWQLVGLWRFKGLRKLVSIDLPKDTNVGHDMIDPVDGKKETDIVYPVLVGLLGAP
jgi:pimeloyl-ACP methyl ester carboxylesterase